MTTDFGYVQGGALVSQGFPANLTSGGTVIPTTVPHSGRESPKEGGTTL